MKRDKDIMIFARRLLIALIFSFSFSFAWSQESEGEEEEVDIVGAIIEDWNDWETAQLSGKLKMTGLPLSPSLKIFMEKDSMLFISVRAPFIGEVGRAEITSDSILVVNKMKKVYVSENLGNILNNYPAKLGDLQELILGKLIFPGIGLLNEENADLLEIYETEQGIFLLPGDEIRLPLVSYGYGIDDSFRLAELMVVSDQDPSRSLDITYQYYDKGYDINMQYMMGDRMMKCMLELDYPEYDVSPMSPIKLGKGFRRVSFQDFMMSLN